jgi:hypothetical protein
MLPVGQVTETRGALGFGFTRRFILNNDEIINLPSLVLVLVPAVADRMIMPVWLTMRLDPWFADYSGNVSPQCTADYPTGGLVNGSSGFNPSSFDCFDSGEAATSVFVVYQDNFNDADTFTDSDCYDQPLGLIVNGTDTNNFGGGDPGNIMTITLNYLLLP